MSIKIFVSAGRGPCVPGGGHNAAGRSRWPGSGEQVSEAKSRAYRRISLDFYAKDE